MPISGRSLATAGGDGGEGGDGEGEGEGDGFGALSRQDATMTAARKSTPASAAKATRCLLSRAIVSRGVLLRVYAARIGFERGIGEREREKTMQAGIYEKREQRKKKE